MTMIPPKHIDVKKDRGVTIEWPDGTTSYFTVKYLRRMSPSAEQRQLREKMAENPLSVLPASAIGQSGEEITITSAEFVGRYAIKFVFSDGHNTGIYSWDYLREIDPAQNDPAELEKQRHTPGASSTEIKRIDSSNDSDDSDHEIRS